MQDSRAQVVIPCLIVCIVALAFFNALVWNVYTTNLHDRLPQLAAKETSTGKRGPARSYRVPPLTQLDLNIADMAAEHREQAPALAKIAEGLTWMAELWPLLVIAGFIFLTQLLSRRFPLAVLWPVVALGGGFINEWVKDIIQRPRQALAGKSSYSFPSGHSFRAIICYGLLAYVLVRLLPQQRWRWISLAVLTLLVLGVGFSRIYLNMHYFSDVLGSFSLGAAWLSLWIAIFEWFSWCQPRKADAAPPPAE